MPKKVKKTTKTKLKPLSPREHYDLFSKVDSEGFFYYLAHYGADMKAIARLGFDVKEIDKAVKLLMKLEEAIDKGQEHEYDDEAEEYDDEEYDDEEYDDDFDDDEDSDYF